MTPRPSFTTAALLALAGLAVTACGGDGAGPLTDDAATPDAGEPVAAAAPSDEIPEGTTLRVGDQLQGLELPLRLAGELDAVPYSIEFASFASGPLVNEALAGDVIDVGPMGDTPALLAEATGLETTVIGASETDADGASLVTLPGSGIEDLEDLEGASIAFTTGSNQQGFVLRALDSVDLASDDVEQVDVPLTDTHNVLLSGGADVAVVYDFIIDAVFEQAPDAVVLTTAAAFVPVTNFLLARDDVVDDPATGAALEDFVARVARARQWVLDNEDAWIEAFYVGVQRLTPELAERAAERQGTFRPITVGPELQAAQQQQADLLTAAGALPAAVDLSPQFEPDRVDRFNEAVEAVLEPTGTG